MNATTVIKTTSRLKALYLVHVKGLRVRAIYCMPMFPLIDTILYARTWVLVSA